MSKKNGVIIQKKHGKLKKAVASGLAFLLSFSMMFPAGGITHAKADEQNTPKVKEYSDDNLSTVDDIFNLDYVVPDMSNLPGSTYDNEQNTPFMLVEQNELYLYSSGEINEWKARTEIFDTAKNLQTYSTTKYPIKDLKNKNMNEAVLYHSINKAGVEKYNKLTEGRMNDLEFGQGVAFDPTGSGRKDHVALLGIEYYGSMSQNAMGMVPQAVVYVQNTITGDYNTIEFDACSWMNWEKVALWYAAGYLSITAGDYDHDGRDTVMISYSGNNDFNIYEIKASYNKKNKLTLSCDTETVYGETQLKPIYKWSKDIPNNVLQKAWDISAELKDKPVVSLTTGDLDGDGIEELAYMVGFYRRSGGKKGAGADEDTADGLNPYCAHVGILDYSNKKWNNVAQFAMYTKGDKTNESKIYNYTIMHGGAITAGDIDGDGIDELVAVGYTDKKALCKVENNKITHVKGVDKFDGDNFATATIKYTGKKYTSSAVDKIETNNFYRANFDSSDYVCRPITLACAKVNGANNPELVFVCGSIYSYDNGRPELPLFEGDMKRSLGSILGGKTGTKQVDSSVNWVQNVTVGNFDGNEAGREQFVFLALEKHSGKEKYSANMAVIAGVDYEDMYDNKGNLVSYGITKTLASSLYMEDCYYHNRSITGNDDNATQIWVDREREYTNSSTQLSCIPIAIDNDNDGVRGKQSATGYAYTDPEVLAVLEAGPYFGELDEAGAYADSVGTSYRFSTSYEYATSTGNNVSFGCGVTAEASGPNLKVAMENGYSLDWSESFEKAVGTSYESEFSAGQQDMVIISRVPEAVYCYDIEGKDGKWIPNGYTIRVPLAPVYFMLTVDDYNKFVKEYNKRLKDYNDNPKNIKKLKGEMYEIGDADLPADHIGNPYAYWGKLQEAGEGAVNLSNGEYSSMKGGGSITSSMDKETSETESKEMSHGFSFSMTMQLGVDLGVAEVWAGAYVNLDYSRSSGSSKTITMANGASGTVPNMDATAMTNAGGDASILEKYSFTRSFLKWTRNLQEEKDDVPFYGYAVKNVKAPAIPVSELNARFTTNKEGEMVILLEWTDPGDIYRPTEYFELYMYDVVEGSKKVEPVKIAKIAGKKTSYLFDGVDGRDEYRFTIKTKSTASNTVSVESKAAVLSLQGKMIFDIELTETNGLMKTYTISYTDGTKQTFTVMDGQNGENGKDGNDGKGDKGDKGDTGAKGDKGDKGDTGAKGDKGDTGTTGATGLSAYEIAVKNGFIGTETEWLASLKGEKGADGANGTNGTNGTNGLNGKSALDVAREETNNPNLTYDGWIASIAMIAASQSGGNGSGSSIAVTPLGENGDQGINIILGNGYVLSITSDGMSLIDNKGTETDEDDLLIVYIAASNTGVSQGI
ncbi:MAG: hypothetical protein K6G24_13615 [Lachnospiraceae bacterium]|nr:hypothetical protein [Lachnospiraceae bacterium]